MLKIKLGTRNDCIKCEGDMFEITAELTYAVLDIFKNIKVPNRKALFNSFICCLLSNFDTENSSDESLKIKTKHVTFE